MRNRKVAAVTAPPTPRSCRQQSTQEFLKPKTKEATVAIVGGGPHALAVLSALHEQSFASPEFQSDATYGLRVGFDSQKLVGSVAVIDPGSNFCDMWNKRFVSLEIDRLRSPLFAHPEAYEEHTLLNFAIATGRTAEISHASGEEVSRDNILRSKLGLGFTLHGKPSAALFQDFCSHLASKHPHEWVQDKATAIVKDKKSGKYRVLCGAGHVVLADAVVLATGPQGKWQMPAPFERLVRTPAVVHTSELFAAGDTLGKAVLARTAHLPPGSHVMVIGGGLSAVQAALAAARAGFRVSLRSREPLRTRDYDVATDWLDRRHANRLRFEFLSTPPAERLAFLRKAAGGGSVPAAYLAELQAEANAGRVEVCVQGDMEQVRVEQDGDAVRVNGERFGLVVLATGVQLHPGSTPLFQQVKQTFPAEFIDGFPLLDSSLRWSEEENIFVVGCNAGLQLGPGALNLMGAMRGGRLVAEELREMMWERKATKRVQAHANLYALLDEESAESEGESEEEEEESDDDDEDERSKALEEEEEEKEEAEEEEDGETDAEEERIVSA